MDFITSPLSPPCEGGKRGGFPLDIEQLQTMNDYSLEDIIRRVHSTKGRLRFKLVDSAIGKYKKLSAEQKEELQKKQEEILTRIKNMQGIKSVRINPIIASMTLTYNPQVTTEMAVTSSLNSIVEEYYPKKT